MPNHVMFAFLFLSSYFFLTVMRFLGDPDFVADWIGFLLELQFGAAIIVGYLAVKIKNKIQMSLMSALLIIAILIDGFLIINIWSNSGKNTVYQNEILDLLKGVKKDVRIFTSGSPVFWLNSQTDGLVQVRGGNDEASIGKYWADGAYQVREGTDPELTKAWLRILGSPVILINQAESQEPFHDFKHPEKFNNYTLLGENNGNFLLGLNGAPMGRVADKAILTLSKPVNGADLSSLSDYVSTFKNRAEIKFLRPDVMTVKASPGKDDAISLAVTYDKNWKITRGKGFVRKDPLGMMIITPGEDVVSEYELRYEHGIFDLILPFIACCVLIIFIIMYDLVFPRIKKGMPKLSLGLHEDEDY